jgi:hypothetical protein
MNTENKEEKRKSRQIWGWILAIVGSVLTYFGIFVLVDGLLGGYTDWYLPVLIISVPCWLLGIPLLIIGVRQIKKRGENEIISTENLALKNEKQLIWGWVAAIVGGYFALVGIDVLLYSVFSETGEWYIGILICTIPGLLLGVLLLIFGICRIKAVNAGQTIDSETVEVRVKRHRIWGWILAIIGGLITIISIGFLSFIYYAMIILSPQKGIVEPYEGYNVQIVMDIISLYILPLFLIGFTLVTLGYIMLKKKEISRQSRGWILNIMGSVYLVAITLSIFYIVMTYPYQWEELGVSFLLWSPLLVLGILGLAFGIRDIRSEEKTTSTDLISIDNSQVELKNESQE